jgi:hypothetical protein
MRSALSVLAALAVVRAALGEADCGCAAASGRDAGAGSDASTFAAAAAPAAAEGSAATATTAPADEHAVQARRAAAAAAPRPVGAPPSPPPPAAIAALRDAVFVPPQRARLGTDAPHFPADAESPSWEFELPAPGLWVDRFEVAAARFAAFVAETD